MAIVFGHALILAVGVTVDVIVFTVLVWRSAILTIFVTDETLLHAVIFAGAKFTAFGSGLGFASEMIAFRLTRKALQVSRAGGVVWPAADVAQRPRLNGLIGALVKRIAQARNAVPPKLAGLTGFLLFVILGAFASVSIAEARTAFGFILALFSVGLLGIIGACLAIAEARKAIFCSSALFSVGLLAGACRDTLVAYART